MEYNFSFQQQIMKRFILTSLRLAKAIGVKNLVIKSDSKLIVGQVNHECEAKEEVEVLETSHPDGQSF